MMKRIRKSILILSLLAAGCLTADAQKFDRGLSFLDSPVFMPKGQMIFGGTISYQDFRFQDYKFLILDDMDIGSFTVKATPYVFYSFSKNMAAGAKFSYQRSMLKISDASLSLTPDMALQIQNQYMIQHTYYGSLSYRYYIPLGKSQVFALFSDVSLSFGAGQGKITARTEQGITGTYQKILDLGLDLIPGLIVFVTNEMAVEASVGVLGVGYKRVSQTTNQVYEGVHETSNANFRINLLSINIGVDFVIPVSKNRKSSE